MAFESIVARQFVRRGRTIDFKAWIAIPSHETQFTANATVVLAGIGFTGPGTILRSRGRLQVSLDSTQVLDDRAKVAVGLGLISTDAFDLGSSAVPDPSGDVDYPWLYWTEVSLRAVAAAETNAMNIRHPLPPTAKCMNYCNLQ